MEGLLAGATVSLSEGEGTFDRPGVDKGRIRSTMTTVSPYERFRVTEWVSVWDSAGWGTGDMTIRFFVIGRNAGCAISRRSAALRREHAHNLPHASPTEPEFWTQSGLCKCSRQRAVELLR